MKISNSSALLFSYLCCVMALTGCNRSLPSHVGVAGDGTLDVDLEFVRDRYGLPALAAVMIRGAQVVETGAVGLRAIGFPDRVTTRDKWHIGSLTKSMTATLAASLVEQGTISWSTTIGDVFPELRSAMRAEYVAVRLDELLHHTAGMPEDMTRAPSWQALRESSEPLTSQRLRLTAEFLALPHEERRGTFGYSNAGYVVAGAMLERVTGRSWEELLRQTVFAPLGMSSTGFGAPGSSGSHDAPWGHRREEGTWQPIESSAAADNPAAIGPAGTVHTTLTDYAQYMMAHLAGARGIGGLVSADTFQRLHTPGAGADVNWLGARYTSGWVVQGGVWRLLGGWAGGPALMHTGSNTLWFAVVWIAPQRDLGLFVVTNAGGDDAEAAIDAAVQVLIRRFEALDAAARHPAS